MSSDKGKALGSGLVTAKIRCGIGNRLFHTMAAAGVAESTGRQLVFFLPRLSNPHHGHFEVLFKLFPTVPLLETFAEWAEIYEKKEDQRIDPQVIQSVSHMPLIVIAGNLQNCDNFPKNVAYFPILPAPLPISTQSWAIHFRFGDYKILPHHQLDLKGYYLQLILKHIPKDSPLTLFSDETARLSNISQELQKYGYATSIFLETDPIETFKAFSACQGGAICPNSTFSWWGAFFAWRRSSSNYSAYFPKYFFSDDNSFNLFTFPFAKPIHLDSLPAEPFLKNFSYK